MLAASAIVLSWHAAPATAATLTWNTTTGNWNTADANWLDGGSPVAWSQTDATTATNSATFAGADGTYTVTTSGVVNAQSVTFNNSGYTISGTALTLRPTSTTNGTITVANNKTATINASIAYSNNAAATLTSNAGSTLNLGGGATNSQYTFNGAGTVNITGGGYQANIGGVNVSAFNLTGGTIDYQPGSNAGLTIGNAAGRNVVATVSTAGTLTLNNTSTNTGSTTPFIAIGNNTNNTTNTTTLRVQSGGTVNAAITGSRAGEIRISNSGNANGLLDVQGGSVNVGIGSTNTTTGIYLFVNGATAGYSSSFTQSGGTVNTRAIQFGGTAGTYDAAATASLALSGGELYVGAGGITKGSGATNLAPTITLAGGTLGAAAAWSSSMDVTLGTAGGGVTVKAASSTGTAGDITLSGILSGSGGIVKTGAGTLTLSGNNTFNGLTIKEGTVNFTTVNNALGSGSVTLGGAGSTGATLLAGRTFSNPITVNAPDSGSNVIGANGAGSGFTVSGGIVLNGNLNIRTNNNVISGSTKATANVTGGITGTGNVLLNNLGLAANVINITTSAVNHVGSLTLQGTATGDTTIGAVIGTNVTSVTQNSATSALVLNGVNTYAGPTNINAGSLRLGATGSIASSSAIAVASGATFDVVAVTGGFTLGSLQALTGVGTVVGNVTANGTLAPGLSGGVGTLSFGNNLSLGSDAILNFGLNGTDRTVGGGVNDLVNLTAGSLVLDGGINVTETVAGSFLSATAGDAWRLFDYTGPLTDNGLTLGTMPSLSAGLGFSIDTATANQVNLVVSVVPEPGTIATALVGLGLGGVAAARRRRMHRGA